MLNWEHWYLHCIYHGELEALALCTWYPALSIPFWAGHQIISQIDPARDTVPYPNQQVPLREY